MSRNRRIVRMFSFDNRSYSLFEKKFVAGYQFMKVERNGDVYKRQHYTSFSLFGTLSVWGKAGIIDGQS